ncbi:MAG: DM13 domain-containing protein [Pseudomonadota bacterium]
MRRLFFWLVTHGIALVIGVGLGIYLLPILTAPDAPDAAMLEEKAASALYSAEFTRDLPGSDFLHWGEGRISLSAAEIVHEGALSPGPDYKVYLTTGPVEDEASFEPLKADAALIGDVKSFSGFLLPVPEGVDVSAYSTIVVWCETFSEFITSAEYNPG